MPVITPETQMALNVLLHDATLEHVEIDAEANLSVCTLAVVAAPLSSSPPVNPCALTLRRLSRIRVALITLDGGVPAETLGRLDIAGINRLIRHFNHPQAGLDFIDSTRENIFAGDEMLDLKFAEKAASHSLTFFWGVGSPGGAKLLLLLRLWFEEADFLAGDGRPVELHAFLDADAYSKAGVPVIVVPASSPSVSAMPDALPAELVAGESLAILFVDSKLRLRAKAVGKGVWGGTQLRWLGPSGTLYDLPAENQRAIRPALAEWRQPGALMSGFSFWTTLQVTDEDVRQGGLVRKYLVTSASYIPGEES